MKLILLAMFILFLCTSCTNKPPETVKNIEFGLNEQGQPEEREVHHTTIIVIDDKPKHKLPKDLTK
ncbi:MAG: hypothetical protein GY928_33360 [Colwellia sp.]|nr:hypothetical protein [Colwellia sp.]